MYPRTSVAAILSLVFGILCWIGLPFVAAIVAVVCGHVARSEIRRAPRGTVDGDGLAIAGLILGWAQILLIVAGFLLIFLFFGGWLFFAKLFAWI